MTVATLSVFPTVGLMDKDAQCYYGLEFRKTRDELMAKKPKRISAREFSSRFTRIVSRHLSTLSPEEQEKRIRNAERAALSANRVGRPITRRVEEIRATPLLSRTRG